MEGGGWQGAATPCSGGLWPPSDSWQ